MQALALRGAAAGTGRPTGSSRICTCGSASGGSGSSSAVATTTCSTSVTASATTRRTRRSGRSYVPFSSSTWLSQPEAWLSYAHTTTSTTSTAAPVRVQVTGSGKYNHQRQRGGLNRTAHVVRCSAQSASESAGENSNSSGTGGANGATSVFTPPEPHFSEHDAWKSLEFQLESVGYV